MSFFRIREARQDDVAGMAKVRVDTWKATYQGIVPDEFLQGLSYQRVAENWKRIFWENKEPNVTRFVAETMQDDIVGIAICGPERNQDSIYHGEIYVLYVLPQYQNRGIGQELVAKCVQYLIQQLKVETMLIWVFAENPYRRFYKSLGGIIVREKTIEIGGKMISEVGYGWEKIQPLVII
jgi:ribosomal protein S18 acetylase RimI-like enzyme